MSPDCPVIKLKWHVSCVYSAKQSSVPLGCLTAAERLNLEAPGNLLREQFIVLYLH